MTCPHCHAALPNAAQFCSDCGMALAAPAARASDPLRTRLQAAVEGQYGLVRLLGRGGMGAVYLARDLELDRLVALKVLPPEVSDRPDRRARFRREAQLAAKLTHPNIVPLHSFGDSDGLLYYVMGYVRGESLADRLRRERTIASEEVRGVLAQLADALDYAHGKGVIHRDIKPDNILLDDETGRPLLADFGIARMSAQAGGLTETGTIVGTMHYMSPEQAIAAEHIDGRADLYALGVVGYVMLAGQTPFNTRSFTDFVAQQASTPAPALMERASDAPPDLAMAMMRCLARDPAQRWMNARAFRDALGTTLGDDVDRLPGELREVAGGLFWSVVGGWIFVHVARAVFSSVFGIIAPPPAVMAWSAVVPAVSFGAMVIKHRRGGVPMAEMRRALLWPPGWWPFWWPARWRRPGDLWVRLPPVVRALRAVHGILSLAALAALPLAVNAESRQTFAWVLFILFHVMTVTMLLTAWWAHRMKMPNNADLRSLIFRSTSDVSFWKRPALASRLLPPPVAAGPQPRTAAEFVRRITAETQPLTGRAREAGLAAVETARLIASAVERIDSDIADAARVLDSNVLAARDARREQLMQSLTELWRQHVRALGEKDDAALDRLLETSQSFSMLLGGDAPAAAVGDTATMGATVGGAATMQR